METGLVKVEIKRRKIIISFNILLLGKNKIVLGILFFKEFNLKINWVIVLATQSIEARARQRGCMQACTIGLSINEDPKLKKGKEKKGSATRSFIRSLSHVSSRDCVYYNIYYNPPFSTSAVILPPPPKKPAFRLCVSILCLWGILIFMLNRRLIIFAILALYLLVKVLRGSRLIRVLVMELFKLLGAAYKVLSGVLG